MAYFIPMDTPIPQLVGDTSLWERYLMVETLVSDGVAAHQLDVQSRLDFFKMSEFPIQIREIETQIYTALPPIGLQHYLTTVRYNALGSPTESPFTP